MKDAPYGTIPLERSKPKYQQLNEDQADLLVRCVMAEVQGKTTVPVTELPFLSQIVKTRIEVMKLPIKFTEIAYVAINAFVNNPGKAVVLLIDALTKYENEIITVDKLCSLYPDGFYTEDSFADYVDNVLKPKQCKWSEIY